MRVDFFCLACRAEGLFTYFWKARRVYVQAAKFTLHKASAKLDTRMPSSTRARCGREKRLLSRATKPLTQCSGILDNIFEPLLTRCTGVFAYTFDFTFDKRQRHVKYYLKQASKQGSKVRHKRPLESMTAVKGVVKVKL